MANLKSWNQSFHLFSFDNEYAFYIFFLFNLYSLICLIGTMSVTLGPGHRKDSLMSSSKDKNSLMVYLNNPTQNFSQLEQKSEFGL